MVRARLPLALVALLAGLSLLVLGAGCQMIVDFDRSRLVDAGPGADAALPDGGDVDGDVDGGVDGGEDGGDEDGGDVDGGDVDGGAMDGDVDGGDVDGGAMDGDVDGGDADGGAMDGGAVDGGAMDGGDVDGGAVDGDVDGGADAGCTLDLECDDGSACTTDACVLGGCVNTAIDCDDANVCTTDACDPGTGVCSHVPAAGSCDDAMACTVGESCSAGACGGGAAVVALAPIDDGSGAFGGVGVPDLVLSELRPGAYVELYNTTGAPIVLSGVSHQLCSPSLCVGLSALAPGVTVPALGYAIVPWPATFPDTAAAGELVLYSMPPFTTDTHVLDYVCWGASAAARQGQAIAVGKWSGGCAAALTGGSIHRRAGVAGDSAGDYDVASGASAADLCVP